METEQDNTKSVITERFITALDYLIDSGKLKTVADFERATGIRSQRITGMRKSISEDGAEKAYYANTTHIVILHEQYGVSLKYLFTGEKPIMESLPTESVKVEDAYAKKELELFKEDFAVLKEKVNLIAEKLSFYLEKSKG